MSLPRRYVLILLLVTLLPLLSGCWNSRELRDLAMVVGMGIDKADGGQGYRVSFQIINPASSSIGSQGGGDVNTISVYSVVDKSLFGALRKASQKVPRQLFFAHIQLLVIGEPLAKEGLKVLFDFYERSHELRLNTPVLVSRGLEAEQVLNLIMPLEPNSALGNAKRIRNTSRLWGHNADMDVADVVKALNRSGNMVLSGIEVIGDRKAGGSKENLQMVKLKAYTQIKGMALFKDGKWVQWIDGDQSRGLMRVLDKVKGTIISVACENQEEGVSIEVIRSKTQLTYRMEEGAPVFHINVKEEGNLNEIHCAIDPTERSQMEELQEQWAAQTQREILQAVKTAQSHKSDYLGFDRKVEATNIELWKSLEGDWPATFSKVKVQVSVDASIRRSGMRSLPYLTKQ